jgi:hypothetical protein
MQSYHNDSLDKPRTGSSYFYRGSWIPNPGPFNIIDQILEYMIIFL